MCSCYLITKFRVTPPPPPPPPPTHTQTQYLSVSEATLENRWDTAEPTPENRWDTAEPTPENRRDTAEPTPENRRDTAKPTPENRRDTAKPTRSTIDLITSTTIDPHKKQETVFTNCPPPSYQAASNFPTANPFCIPATGPDGGLEPTGSSNLPTLSSHGMSNVYSLRCMHFRLFMFSILCAGTGDSDVDSEASFHSC